MILKFNARASLGLSTSAVALFVAVSLPQAAFAQADSEGVAASPADAELMKPTSASDDQANEGDIIVTAQKRSETANSVPMSITAASGALLQSRGIVDASQLAKIVPGFNYNSTSYGAPVYTIRGVGFEDSSLAAAPAVSVYVDEVPLPYSAETLGASLDLERIEVLKGPQGTLYGQNSTGGAVNYIAAKPTDHFTAGIDGSYGRFNTTDISGFISSPLSDTLKFRVAARSLRADAWQQSYTRVDSVGKSNLLQGRAALDWKPTDRLSVVLTASGWHDRSDSQAQQAVAILSQTVAEDLFPALAVSPTAPASARAADWDPGVTYRRNNWFAQGALRLNYELTDDITLTSLTAYQKYHRFNPVDGDGTQYQAIYFINSGQISTIFQELRLGGDFGGNGHWIIGGNYQKDKTHDSSLLYVNESSTRYVHDLLNENQQNVVNKAVYASGDVDLTRTVSITGGIRYTQTDRSYEGCSRDSGDGLAAAVFGTPVGACVTATPTGPGLVLNQLNQNNVSWRAGINYKPANDTLVYANVSKGYKAGSFPILSAISYQQLDPVTQESLLAYEGGFKAALFGKTLQLNAALFYYDYKNKQIRGKVFVPIFNNLETLVNVPKSHVLGFEVSANWRPAHGVTISPSITMVKSKIDGTFINYTSSGTLGNFSGEPFPYTPKWSGNTDAEYKWRLGDGDVTAFVGTNISYQTRTFGGFGQLPDYKIRGYVLVDLRAGVEAADGKWRASVFGHNVTNQYYWTTADHFTDAITRYAGMPVTYGVSLAYRFR